MGVLAIGIFLSLVSLAFGGKLKSLLTDTDETFKVLISEHFVNLPKNELKSYRLILDSTGLIPGVKCDVVLLLEKSMITEP